MSTALKFSHADINRMVKDALDARSGKRQGGLPQTPIERLRAMMSNAKNKVGIPHREL